MSPTVHVCNTTKLRKGIDWDENGKTYKKN